MAKLLALLPLLFAWMSIRQFAARFPAIRRRLFRHAVRFVRHWRAYSSCSDTVRALYHLGFGMALVAIALILCGLKREADIVLVAVAAIIAWAGCSDIAAKLARILRAAWAPTLGKLLSVTLCVVLATAALSLAKQTAHTLAHVDPKYLTEFVAILTVGMLPVVYGTALMSVLALYGMFQLAILAAFMLLSMPLQFVKPYVTSNYWSYLRTVWYRLRTGKQPPGGVMPAPTLFALDELPYFAKPMGTMVVVLLLSYVLHSVFVVMPVSRPLLANTLVWLEYREASACTNLPAGLRVAYMEGGYVSAAVPDGTGYRFEVMRCELEKAANSPGA